MSVSAYADGFARERLPSAEEMPELIFGELRYPERLNAAAELLERRIPEIGNDRPCLLAPGDAWSYGRLRESSNRIARVLVDDLGLVPGNRVLLRAPNTPMLAACWFAVLKAGGIAVTTMPLYRAGELRFMLEKAAVRHALCDARLREELERACESLPHIQIAYFGYEAPLPSIETLMDSKPVDFAAADTAAEDVALIAFTSGTTGAPKAAMHYHRDLLAICDTYCARVLQPNGDDLFCGSPPLGFTFGLGGLLLFPLHAGAATVLLEKAGPNELLTAIDEYGVTTLFTAPVAYRAMAQTLEAYDISTLRACVSAGESLPQSVWEEWYAKTGLKILDGIGSTEMLHIFIGSPAPEARAGATGRVVPGYAAEVHDGAGRAVPDGSVGRLAVRGPTGCKYLDDERQATYVQRGWNYPGDAYMRDADGYFRHVARTDDMIVASGYNISGPEVEHALCAHPYVREAAVVAKRDPQKETNCVKAFVVLASDCDADVEMADELRAFCKARLAPFKAPREIEFVTALPRTETGKLQRYKLRD